MVVRIVRVTGKPSERAPSPYIHPRRYGVLAHRAAGAGKYDPARIL